MNDPLIYDMASFSESTDILFAKCLPCIFYCMVLWGSGHSLCHCFLHEVHTFNRQCHKVKNSWRLSKKNECNNFICIHRRTVISLWPPALGDWSPPPPPAANTECPVVANNTGLLFLLIEAGWASAHGTVSPRWTWSCKDEVPAPI